MNAPTAEPTNSISASCKTVPELLVKLNLKYL